MGADAADNFVVCMHLNIQGRDTGKGHHVDITVIAVCLLGDLGKTSRGTATDALPVFTGAATNAFM